MNMKHSFHATLLELNFNKSKRKHLWKAIISKTYLNNENEVLKFQ